jgi:hypothetical protein
VVCIIVLRSLLDLRHTSWRLRAKKISGLTLNNYKLRHVCRERESSGTLFEDCVQPWSTQPSLNQYMHSDTYVEVQTKKQRGLTLLSLRKRRTDPSSGFPVFLNAAKYNGKSEKAPNTVTIHVTRAQALWCPFLPANAKYAINVRRLCTWRPENKTRPDRRMMIRKVEQRQGYADVVGIVIRSSSC